MMVISRRLGEGIVINGNIHITVVKIGGGRIRLGLTAPASVRIHRREELFPNVENSDGFEVLDGSSLVEPTAHLAFSLRKDPKATLARRKGRGIETKPQLAE